MTRRILRAAQILWPAFVVAGVLEMVVFSAIDPDTLSIGSWTPGATTVYSVGFLIFWALIALAAASTQWMSGSEPADVEPASAGKRTVPARHHGKAHHA